MGAAVDIAELERGKIADGRTKDEVRDREAARDAIAGLDLAAIGDVDRTEERTGTAENRTAGDVGRDVHPGVATEEQRAAVDVDGDRAGEVAGRSHGEGAATRLDEFAGTGTIDIAAEGAVRTHGELAIEAEEDRATRGARAFEGSDGLRGAVEVKLGARDIRQADNRVGREIAAGTGLDRAAVDRGLEGIGLGGVEGPHPCPALREGSRVAENGGQRAVAGTGQDEGAVDAIRALGVERSARTIKGEHARVGTQGERAAIRRTEAHGPGIVTGDILEQRRGRVDAEVGDITGQL